MNNKKIIPIMIILAVVFAILGATFAYWSWASDNANKTNVTFTIAADFSCGINGEGNITGANLAPASCTNSTYAIQRAITTTITNNGSDPVSMDMWLKVNSIDSGLSGTSNFKWALTTDSTSCTNNEVSHGSFQGKTSNSTITLFTGETNTATYYLYIWLDSAETSTATQNQSFSLSIGGACTNEVAEEDDDFVYTANRYDNSVTGHNEVWIGQTIPNSVATYTTANQAMAALKTATGGANDIPFYLAHKLDSNGTVTDSYVGFVITPEMATANSGLTAGTYTLKGGDDGDSFVDNAKTLYDAFGGSVCRASASNGPLGVNPYTTEISTLYSCEVTGLYAVTFYDGSVGVNNGSLDCAVYEFYDSYCT